MHSHLWLHILIFGFQNAWACTHFHFTRYISSNNCFDFFMLCIIRSKNSTPCEPVLSRVIAFKCRTRCRPEGLDFQLERNRRRECDANLLVTWDASFINSLQKVSNWLFVCVCILIILQRCQAHVFGNLPSLSGPKIGEVSMHAWDRDLYACDPPILREGFAEILQKPVWPSF